MRDNELKLNTVYWAEIIDETLKEIFGSQLQLKFTGIFFRELNNEKSTYLLSQIKIFREAKIEDTL